MAEKRTIPVLNVNEDFYLQGVEVTATAAEINNAADLSNAAEIVAATNVITSAENKKTFYLSSSTEFVSTLPAPFLGAEYVFVVAAAPSGASYTIVTAGAPDQIIVGGVHDAGGAAGDVESTAGGTTITFVDGQAVVGDTAILRSDGTSWFARIFVNVATGATITG